MLFLKSSLSAVFSPASYSAPDTEDAVCSAALPVAVAAFTILIRFSIIITPSPKMGIMRIILTTLSIPLSNTCSYESNTAFIISPKEFASGLRRFVKNISIIVPNDWIAFLIASFDSLSFTIRYILFKLLRNLTTASFSSMFSISSLEIVNLAIVLMIAFTDLAPAMIVIFLIAIATRYSDVPKLSSAIGSVSVSAFTLVSAAVSGFGFMLGSGFGFMLGSGFELLLELSILL